MDALVLLVILILVWIAWPDDGRKTRDSSPGALKAIQDETAYYAVEAENLRALSRKLDEDTRLAESYIQAMRAKAHSDDVLDMIERDEQRRLTNDR